MKFWVILFGMQILGEIYFWVDILEYGALWLNLVLIAALLYILLAVYFYPFSVYNLDPRK